MLKIEGLTRRFGEAVALDSVSLSVAPNEFVGVIGRSGAGKSTLLRLINRLVEPSAGKIMFDGADVTRKRGRALRDWRRQAAMIFQQFALIDQLSVLDNVLVGRLALTPRWRTWTLQFRPEDRALAIEALHRLDMAEYALKRADELSGGQQQRVAIARALVQQPRLMLADEPVASLDPRSTTAVMDALQRINAEDGLPVICNLHHIDLARRYCTRIVGVRRGRVVFDGPVDALDDAAIHAIYDE
ncbi:phosphonate ABC transporter ATP-binding protein [Pararhodobacter sp.]|uniref:phosphonate ABC transporter ATP-binding protein n=1 Tax=Pararhodobacter sp. TaxID=2127056 RepID=UPI002FDE3D16